MLLIVFARIGLDVNLRLIVTIPGVYAVHATVSEALCKPKAKLVDLIGGQWKLNTQIRAILPVDLRLLIYSAFDGDLRRLIRYKPICNLRDPLLVLVGKHIRGELRLVPIEMARLKVKRPKEHEPATWPAEKLVVTG